MLYLINKTPVCSQELGDFPLSAAGGQRELQSPEGSRFELEQECRSMRVVLRIHPRIVWLSSVTWVIVSVPGF